MQQHQQQPGANQPGPHPYGTSASNPGMRQPAGNSKDYIEFEEIKD